MNYERCKATCEGRRCEEEDLYSDQGSKIPHDGPHRWEASGDAVFCEHVNEVRAAPWCPCPPDCYCYEHTCRNKVRNVLRPETPTPPWPSTLSSDQADLLRWAASRPGVLSLLEALRAANYDESGTEYLDRVAKQGPRREARLVCSCETDASSGTHIPSCKWYEARPMPIPTIDPADPPRVTITDVDAEPRTWWLGCEPPKPAPTEPWPYDDRSSYGGGPDDFGGEDFACFTGSEEEKRATDMLIERLKWNKSAEAPEAPALKVESRAEGRQCAEENCQAPATRVIDTWMWGDVPVCDRHGKGE